MFDPVPPRAAPDSAPYASAPYVPVAVPVATRSRRRPIFGGIAFALVVAAYVTLAAVAFWAKEQTQDAFIQLPPWWSLTFSIAAFPVAILGGLGLLLGIVGTARREKPGWPAITAMILSLPVFGYLAVAAYIWMTVAASCAGPGGACG